MTQRVVVYPSDIALLTGRSIRYGQKVIQEIKRKHQKKNHQLVTIEEVAEYLGISEGKIQENIT